MGKAMMSKPSPKRPNLDVLLAKAKEHKVTNEELQEQHKNYVISEMTMGNDADEAAYRSALDRNDKEEIKRLDEEAEERRQRAIKIMNDIGLS